MKIRWALRFLFFVFGSYLAVAMVLRTEWAGAQICSRSAGLVSRLLGEPVVLTECSFDPWRTRVAVEGIRFGAGPSQFAAERVEVRFSPFSLGRTFGISQVEVVAPKIVLDLSGEAESDPTPAAQTGCLEPLQRYPINWASVQDAALSLYLPGGQTLELEGVGVEVSKEGRMQRLGLRIAGGRWIDGDGAAVELERLGGELALDVGEERLDVESFTVASLGSSLSVSGRVERICAPQLGIRADAVVDLAQVAGRFAPEIEGVAGVATLGAALEGPLGDVRGDARLALVGATIDGMEPGDLSAELRYAAGALVISDLVWPVGEGRAIVSAEVELGGDFPLVAQVRTEGLDFHRLMARLTVKNTPVMMTVDSVHRLEGRLLRGFVLEGTSHLDLRGFRVRNVPWHQGGGTVVVEVPAPATLAGRTRIDAAGVHLSAARAAFGETHLDLDARLYFDDQRGLQITARAPAFHLDDVRAHVAGIPIRGVGMIEAEIEGPYADPAIIGRVDFAEAGLYAAELGRLRAEVTSQPATGELTFREVEGQIAATPYEGWVDLHLGDDATIEGAVQLAKGGRLEQAFGAARELLTPLAWLEEQVTGQVQKLEASFRGELPDLQAVARVEATGVRILDRPFDSLEATVQLPDLTALHLEGLRARRGAGVAKGAAVFRFPEGAEVTVDATLDAEELPLRDLLGEFGEWAELEGEVEAELRLTGPIDRLDVRGSLHGTGLAAKGVGLEPTYLSLETQADQVVVRGAVVGAGNLSAAIRLVDGLPFDASLALEAPRLSELFLSGTRLDGRVRGQATAVGSLSDLSSASGMVALDELVLFLAEYRVESREAVVLRFDGPTFTVDSVDLEGENTSLSLSGGRTRDGRLDLSAQGSFDARLIGSFLPELEHPSGVVTVAASMTGTADRPVLVGSAQVRRGAFRFRDLPLQVQGLEGDLAFSQNQVVIQHATFTANGGRARAGGSVSLRGFLPDVLDLVFDVRGMSWRMPADWPAVGTGRIALTGRWTERLLVSGEARIDRLRWLKDLDLEKTILDFRRKVQVVPPADAREWLFFDLDLVGGDDMRVDSSHVRARLHFVGDRLRLVGSNVHPALLGSVEVSEGVAFFRGNEYRVTNGMVDFRERDRIDPSFDLTAETEVREYRIAAHAWGKLEDFQVDLQADPLLAQADILTLLTFGITSRDLDTGGGTAFSGASLAAEALLTVSGLDEHVKRWLPRTPLLMDPDLSVTSQYSELTGQMEPMAVFEAKVLTDRLKLSAAAPFATTKGRRAAAEVRVSDHLSGELSWQNEAVGYGSGDLGFDLKLRWEWE